MLPKSGNGDFPIRLQWESQGCKNIYSDEADDSFFVTLSFCNQHFQYHVSHSSANFQMTLYKRMKNRF